MEENKNDEIEIDLKELFFVLKEKIWIIILTMLVGVLLAFGYTTFCTQPVYNSTAMLYVLSKSTSITSLTDIQLGTQLTQDYMVFITSRPVVEKTISELGLNMDYKELVSSISVDNPSNSRILYITVKNSDAYMAKEIVDKLAEVSAKRMAEVMVTDEPNIVDYGHVAEEKAGPSMKKNCAIGGLLGLVLAVAIIIIMYLLNDRICTPEDLEKYLDMDTLGVIPMAEGVSKKKTRGKDETHKNRKQVK